MPEAPPSKIALEKKPHLLDPSYVGPSRKDLDRADQMDKAIRQHEARQARQGNPNGGGWSRIRTELGRKDKML